MQRIIYGGKIHTDAVMLKLATQEWSQGSYAAVTDNVLCSFQQRTRKCQRALQSVKSFMLSHLFYITANYYCQG